MSEAHTAMHPLAPHHLPKYMPGPDGSDPLFVFVAVFMVIVFVLLGVAYFKLHSLPEHLGYKYNSTQLQLISILAIMALFTHNNLYWVIALIIAVVNLPDFLTPVKSIAASLSIMVKHLEKTGGEPPAPESSRKEDTEEVWTVPAEEAPASKPSRKESEEGQ